MLLFVDPQYELKPENWKTCYRAGPEAVGTRCPGGGHRVAQGTSGAVTGVR
jgi:hypothetical protein